MKILYITTIGKTMGFFKTFIRELLDAGHCVDIATNENGSAVPEYYREWGCKVHPIQTSRSPLSKGNLSAIRQIKQLVEEKKYDIVHCHTPVAAMCTRLACRKARKSGTKVFYTAHGFHFFKGAPLKNWLLFYPVEKICSYFTDVLITINQEDFAFAKKKMNAKQVEYIPGMGLDLEKFGKTEVDREAKRRELGIPEEAILLLSVGELNGNKNHETVIRAIADLDVYYIIAGDGGLKGHLQAVIDELGLTERVKLLGYRTDVNGLCQSSDIFCFPSKREGLGLAALEAMANGLPIVGSNIHGIKDYLIHGETGFSASPQNIAEFKNGIELLCQDFELRRKMGENNKETVKSFDIKRTNSILKSIYNI